MVPEARLEDAGSGLAPAADGWFVVNVRDARWSTSENSERKPPGSDCRFESREAPFPQLGIKIRVIEPGQPNAMYHAENQQEDFLVLSGECRLIVEGEERPLRAWDFVHCPPGTHHVFVGSGDGPCAILMVGARLADESLYYPVSELAARYGASVETETTDFGEVYPRFEPSRPKRPSYWEQLPWAAEDVADRRGRN
jgi:uncharacterized cupin superfamily protein